MNKVDRGLRHYLPRSAYAPMLAGYHGLRKVARRNPGRGRMLPEFVIIGAAKCGTTSLYAWLCDHPRVEKAQMKEIHYFSFYNYRGVDWYRQHFPSERERKAFTAKSGRPFITGEASPSYMMDPAVPRRMAELLPEARLIVSLRDPISRAYSQFQMRRRDNLEPVESFLEALALEDPQLDGGAAQDRARSRGEDFASLGRTYLLRSRYAEQLETWFEYFPREQFHVLTTDSLTSDPQRALDHLHEFLGLEAHQPADLSPRFGSAYEPLPDASRVTLREYFRPHNERLRELLGLEFEWDR